MVTRTARSGCITFVISLTTIATVTCKADDAKDETASARESIRAIVKAAATGASGSKIARPSDGVDGAAVKRWLQANEAGINGVRPGPLSDLPWGFSTFRSAENDDPPRVFLHVFDWHASGKVIAYGLTGGVRRAYVLADRARVELPVSKTARAVIVSAAKDPPDPLATVIVLELDGEPETTSLAITPSEDGRIVLQARDAIVHGAKLRYEPEPNKDTLGYWTEAGDWARWQFEVVAPGTYSVEILQGCGKGSGGSIVEFSLGDRTIPFTVEETGGFQNFVPRRIGTFRFDKPGRFTLWVKATKKPGVAVMDLRSVTLTPIAKR